jgi:hypothetical protein
MLFFLDSSTCNFTAPLYVTYHGLKWQPRETVINSFQRKIISCPSCVIFLKYYIFQACYIFFKGFNILHETAWLHNKIVQDPQAISSRAIPNNSLPWNRQKMHDKREVNTFLISNSNLSCFCSDKLWHLVATYKCLCANVALLDCKIDMFYFVQ